MQFLAVGALIGASLALSSCSGDQLVLPKEGEPAAIAALSGNAQSGSVGMPLPDSLVARVTDSRNRPVAGQPVVFALEAGGTGGRIAPDTVSTDADGRAAALWTLGMLAGGQQAQAKVIGAPNPLVVPFTATASAGSPAGLSIVSGNSQAAPAGTALHDSLVVRAADAGGNPVTGVTVHWTVTGGGAVSPASVTTDVAGRAATQRTLGPAAGVETTVASASGVPGAPVTFTQTATAGSAARLAAVSGDHQSAVVATQLPQPLVVSVVDQKGNGVPGQAVAWVVGQGGGTVSPPSSATDASGQASTSWTLGPAVGANTVSAVVSGVGTVDFAATATAAAAARLAAAGGDGQSGPAGSALPTALAVKATDATGNPASGRAITWSVASGGGSLSAASAVTGADGVAQVRWTLGAQPGRQTVTASATGLTGSPVTFGATATVGAASKLGLVTQPSASATSGVPFAQQPVVQLQDAAGNSVGRAGVAVTVAIASGGGTLQGTASVATDAGGRASFSGLAIVGAPGQRTLIFAASGQTSVTSGAITVGAGAPSPSTSTVTASPATFVAGSGSSTITVTVRDAVGTPISGATVTISVSGDGNSVSQPGPTNASGVATGSFTAAASGTKTVSATANGVVISQTASVTVTAPPPVPASMSGVSGDLQTATASTALSAPLVVRVLNSANAPAAGVNVSWAVTSGTGTLSSAAVTTGADGLAQVTWTLGPELGTQSATASVAGLTGSPVTFNALATAPPPPPPGPLPPDDDNVVQVRPIGP